VWSSIVGVASQKWVGRNENGIIMYIMHKGQRLINLAQIILVQTGLSLPRSPVPDVHTMVRW
jgi:hypothetical protein